MKTKKHSEIEIVSHGYLLLTFDKYLRIFPDGHIEPTACLDSTIDFDKMENSPLLYNDLESAVNDILSTDRKRVYVAIKLATNLTIVMANKDYMLSKVYLHE